MLTSARTVGFGSDRHVSVAVNSAGRIVALKHVSVVKRTLAIVVGRRRTLETLTKLAVSAHEDRLLHLIEFISNDPTKANPSIDMWFVLEPAVETPSWI